MDFPRHIPFVELLGFELVSWGGGEAEIALEMRDELSNSWSVTHGGVMMTLLDVVMAHAARSEPRATASGAGVVTIEMKTSFMRPGMGRLLARGRLQHRTASIAFCEGSACDGEGKLVAHATATFKYLKGLPVGDRKIQRDDASD